MQDEVIQRAFGLLERSTDGFAAAVRREASSTEVHAMHALERQLHLGFGNYFTLIMLHIRLLVSAEIHHYL